MTNASNLTRLAGFGLALALVFGAAWTAGQLAGPVDVAASPQSAGHDGEDSGHDSSAGEQLPGLATMANGYRLVAGTTHLAVASPQPFPFQILDHTGTAITEFAVQHDKRMHLIVVRRDGSHYQHVHPEMTADGTWSVPLEFPAGGSYRVFADFQPAGGTATTLGTDVHVAGDYRPVRFPIDSRTSVVDGYQVLMAGTAMAGASATFTATVLSNGRPVTDLQPYLDAYGHLVALRGDDLAYLHVHPHQTPASTDATAGPAVEFTVELPSGGQYRFFFDFKHDDVVRTADFTVEVTGGGPNAPAEDAGHEHGHG